MSISINKHNRVLTLAVPTYNRKNAIVSNASKVIGQLDKYDVNYLVIDNASTDGTYDELKKVFSVSDIDNIKIKKNPSNLGYLGNIIEILRNCETEYVLFSSDEDAFNLEEIPGLLVFLKSKKPMFVSCAVGRNGRLRRGSRTIKKVGAHNVFKCTPYVSGLAFRCDELTEIIEYILSKSSNKMVHFYPHVLLAVISLMRGDCYLYNKKLVDMVFELETMADNYTSIDSRFEQMLGFNDFIDGLEVFDFFNKNLSKKMKNYNVKRFFYFIRGAVKDHDDGYLRAAFDDRLCIYYFKYLIKRPFLFLKRFF